MAEGAPGERTALAWQRTGVSGSLLGAVAVLAAARDGNLVLVGIASVAAAACAGFAGHIVTRHPTPSPWHGLVTTAAIPVILGAVGLLLAVAG